MSEEQKNDPQAVVEEERDKCYEGCIKCYGNCLGFCNTWICCCATSPYKRVYEGYSAAVQEFGAFQKVLGPGLHYINPCTEEIIFVDKRERVLDIRKQNCFTKDNIDIFIDAVIYYQVEHTYKSLYEIANVPLAVAELARTSLRDIFGTITLQESLEDREIQA